MIKKDLTMRLEGGAIVTFISQEQKERFIKNHFHKGVFIHGFNAVRKNRNGYFFVGEKIPKEIAIKNNFKITDYEQD